MDCVDRAHFERDFGQLFPLSSIHPARNRFLVSWTDPPLSMSHIFRQFLEEDRAQSSNQLPCFTDSILL